MTDSKENDDEIMDNIQIYSNDEEKLKFLGQILSNETSRKILQVLFDNELTASEISFETGVSLSLINHHMITMLQSKIVTVSKTTTNSKNQPMKHYTAKSSIMILPKKVSHNKKGTKYLSATVKTLMKLSGIVLAGIISWFITNPYFQYSEISNDVVDQEEILINSEIPIIISLCIVGIGLSLQFWLNKRNKKKVIS